MYCKIFSFFLSGKKSREFSQILATLTIWEWKEILFAVCDLNERMRKCRNFRKENKYIHDKKSRNVVFLWSVF